MSYRSLAYWFAVLFVLVFSSAPGRAQIFVDAAARRVPLPAQIDRVMPAGQSAAVLLYVLEPQKLAGWVRPLSPEERGYLPTKYARLPVVGDLTGPRPTATAATVERVRPDLIVYLGKVTPETVALADRIETQTQIPFIILKGTIEDTPELLRRIGALLGAASRGDSLANDAQQTIDSLRGQLLIEPASTRPVVYYGIGYDGLTTALVGSNRAADLAEAGAVNAAAPLGPGGLVRITRAQLLAWNPEVIIASRARFYNELKSDPEWRGLRAVRNSRIYLAPQDPFGWIDRPESVNRILGLSWLSTLFYPSAYEQDLRTIVKSFYAKFYDVNLTKPKLEALVRSAESHPGEIARGSNLPLFGLVPAPPIKGLPNPQGGGPAITGKGRLRSPGPLLPR